MISVKIVADSLSVYTGQRVITFELEYPRFIHSQVMTHRLFSRNSSSSRAIPIERMIELVLKNTASPIHWGANQKGMQSHEEISATGIEYCKGVWASAMRSAVDHARLLADYNVHKEVVNRLLEPFQMMKVLLTSTSFDNFYALRLESLDPKNRHSQPEIWELARLMYLETEKSTPFLLNRTEWHTPYIYRERNEAGEVEYSSVEIDDSGTETDGYHYHIKVDKETALKISTSCCAQVSYRKLDFSLEKALAIYDKLTLSDPIHASAFEHCARPIEYGYIWQGKARNLENNIASWEKGITGVRVIEGEALPVFTSGNFDNFIQYRQLIPNNVCNNFVLA